MKVSLSAWNKFCTSAPFRQEGILSLAGISMPSVEVILGQVLAS